MLPIKSQGRIILISRNEESTNVCARIIEYKQKINCIENWLTTIQTKKIPIQITNEHGSLCNLNLTERTAKKPCKGYWKSGSEFFVFIVAPYSRVYK